MTFEMKPGVPSWAMHRAGPGDYYLVREAQGRGTLQVGWPDRRSLREWARRAAWPAPRLVRSRRDFYAWAHGRYYALEEGYDHWIGDDRS